MKIGRFEDVEAWKAARVLVSQVYDMTRQAQDTGRDYRFRDQVTAAGRVRYVEYRRGLFAENR